MTELNRRDFLRGAAAATLRTQLPAFGAEASPDLRMWYRKPAANWNEALPIGNGRMGAMIFGGIGKDHLQLNEDTLYSDEPGRSDLPLDVTKKLEEVESLLRSGNYAAAGDVITRNWTGRAWPCFQPLADLYLDSDEQQDLDSADYARELDLSSAMARVAYRRRGTRYVREYFASFPDRVIVVRLASNKAGSLSFRASLDCAHPTAATEIRGSNLLVLRGQAPGFVLRRTLEWVENRGEQWKYPEVWDAQGMRRARANTVLYGSDVGGRGTFFEVRLRIATTGGTVAPEEGGFRVEGASEAVLLLAAATSYNGSSKSPSREGVDPAKQCSVDCERAAKKSYSDLKARHVADYQSLFQRVSLALGPPTEQSKLPVDERIGQFANGQDSSLAALYFQFARYLMISGSRPGTQPLNLQGVWNDRVIPPWASGYTTNINLQMNYWAVEVFNLAECFEPLNRLIQETAKNGRIVAQTMYQRRGLVIHHNTTLWRGAQPVDNNALPAFWNMGAAWLVQHLWEHYRFTSDPQDLEAAYPVMKAAAEFMSDWLTKDANGHLVTMAGVSPENTFIYRDGTGKPKIAGVCMGPTMDIAIIRELFGNCIEASEKLNRDTELREELKRRLAQLLPYKSGSRGQLQEWPVDFEETEPHHRHTSHLYGLHPGHQITRDTPELRSAAMRTLELRGDEAAGWSRAWRVCMWARLEEGNRAYAYFQNLFAPVDMAIGKAGMMPNLFPGPTMQVDANFGGGAGMAEMLLQSQNDEIHLLPALPDAWAEGRVRGMCARGGVRVSLTWSNGKLLAATLWSDRGGTHVVRYRGHNRTIRLRPQVPYHLSARSLEVGPG